MSNTDISAILDDLATGRIDAAEAKRRIDAARPERHGPPDTDPDATVISTEWPQPEANAEDYAKPEEPHTVTVNGIDRILVKATARKVRIVADRNVKTAAAEDVHQTKRTGTTLEINGDKEFTGIGNVLGFARSIRGLDDVKALGVGQELTVRVNPDLRLDVEVSGSSLLITDVPHLGKIRVTAGMATITGVSEVSDLVVQAGQATIAGLLTTGWSRLRCESGSLVVAINEDSDVTARAFVQLGRIAWVVQDHDVRDNEITIGRGTAKLDVSVVVGHAQIRLGVLPKDDEER